MLPLFALFLLWLLWLVVWLVATVAPLRIARKLHLHEELVYRLVALAATALLFTLTPWPGLDVQYRLWHRALDDDLSWRLVMAVGASLAIAGWALLHRHIAVRRGASIVTSGPYAIVRQPIYLSLIAAMFATAMLFGRPSSVAGTILFALAFVTKAVIEEQRTQGPAFAAYKHRTLMFVPVLGFVWYLLTWLLQRPAQSLARDKSRTPAPVAPTGNSEDFAPLSRVRSVALELILDDEKGVETSQNGGR